MDNTHNSEKLIQEANHLLEQMEYRIGIVLSTAEVFEALIKVISDSELELIERYLTIVNKGAHTRILINEKTRRDSTYKPNKQLLNGYTHVIKEKDLWNYLRKIEKEPVNEYHIIKGLSCIFNSN